MCTHVMASFSATGIEIDVKIQIGADFGQDIWLSAENKHNATKFGDKYNRVKPAISQRLMYFCHIFWNGIW